jgi:two-component system CheB/CheR fusion protein
VRLQLHRGLALAAASYLLAAALTRTLWSSLFHHAPFTLFFGAAAVAAWFGGFWLGFGVALLGAITVCALVGDLGPAILAASLVMIGVAALISYLAEHSREIDSEREEAKRLLDTVLDHAPVGIALFDRELHYIRVNDALARIDGVPVAAHLGKTVGEVLPQLDGDLTADLRRVLETGEPLSREISGETPATPGKLRHWSIYAYALPLRGEIIGVGAVCEEVTAKKRAQEELRLAKEQAEAANEAKDHFLATLSHELRTPLTPVLAIASLLEEEERLPGYARKHLAMVRRNVELEARLIDDLLDLTRISRGKIELHPVPTDACQLLRDALHTCCQRDIDSGRIHLESALAGASHPVRADAPRLSQVFWNLLNNAIKFTPDGGTVAVRTRIEDGQLAVSVADTGIGIEPARLPHIFEAFDQGDPAVTARFGGLGLGLAISRAIVELHGGTLSAESAGRGRGATFTVRLPLEPSLPATDGDTSVTAPAAPEDVGAKPAKPQPAALEASGDPGEQASPGASGDPAASGDPGGAAVGHLRILLIEDHGDTAAAMADLLGGLGHEVTVAGSVASARAAVQGLAVGGNGLPVDLVISDLGLPDGNGRDLMRELSRHYGLKGIALSGYGMEEDRDKSLRAGFSQHLTKPIHPRALQQAIREVVSSG